MLNFHLICSVSVFFIFFSFLLFNIYIEAKNLHDKLYLETKLLNIEQYTKFNSYLVQFNRSYKDEEYFRRLQNFRESLEEISRLNKLDPSAKYGITQFSDMSKEEFSRRMSINKRTKCLNIDISCKLPKSVEIDDYKSYEGALEFPDAIDWRAKGIIGPVLDQKVCAACWAISIVGVMEAMLARNRKYRESLSVQEMLDCTTAPAGCGGGSMVTVLRHLCLKYYNDSITTEDNYSPLIMIKEKCKRVRPGGLRTRVAWFKRECGIDEKYKLPSLIANVGPVAVVINAVPLQSYIEGIVQYSCHRDPDSLGPLEHAIQIVGYNTSNDIPYYILKNSWGESFGMDGYVMIAMNNNVCGIADEIISLNVTTY